jgi:hypothetical protein
MRKSTKQKLIKKPNITITIEKKGKKPEIVKNPEAYVLFAMLKKPDDKTNKEGEALGFSQMAGQMGDILFCLYQLLEAVREDFGMEELQRILHLFFQRNLSEIIMLSKMQQMANDGEDRVVN